MWIYSLAAAYIYKYGYKGDPKKLIDELIKKAKSYGIDFFNPKLAPYLSPDHLFKLGFDFTNNKAKTGNFGNINSNEALSFLKSQISKFTPVIIDFTSVPGVINGGLNAHFVVVTGIE